MLTRDEARAIYDRVGPRQDRQGWYEDEPIRRLLGAGQMQSAASVFELGSGTGRVAAHLLGDLLPAEANYRGVDISPRMCEIASARLSRWRDRASVCLVDGSLPFAAERGTVDRFLCTYVLDLLTIADIGPVLAEAERLLVPGGLLLVASLTDGTRFVSRCISRAWRAVHALRPSLVGGCRPLRLAGLLDGRALVIVHDEIVSCYGLSSEIVVARRS